MKLIIDIDEEVYKAHKMGDVSPWIYNGISDAVINGTPLDDVLDKIRAELEGLTYYWCEVNPKSVIDDALQIIDKYKAESEDGEKL